MLDRGVPLSGVPFFWTRFWDKALQYTGHASQFDDVHITGDISKQTFLAWYFYNKKVVAAAAMNQPSAVMIINEAMK